MGDRLREPQVAIAVVGIGFAAIIAGVGLLAIKVAVNYEYAAALIVAGVPLFLIGLILLAVGPAKKPTEPLAPLAVSHNQSGGMNVGQQNISVQTNTFGTAAAPEPAAEITPQPDQFGRTAFVWIYNPGVAEKFCVRLRAFSTSGIELRALWRTGEEERLLKKGDQDWCRLMMVEPDEPNPIIFRGELHFRWGTEDIRREIFERWERGQRLIRLFGQPQNQDIVVVQGNEYVLEVVVLSDKREPVIARLSYGIGGKTIVMPFNNDQIEVLIEADKKLLADVQRIKHLGEIETAGEDEAEGGA
jgi:hypothetical protein